MKNTEDPEHHLQRSELIRKIVQKPQLDSLANVRYKEPIPKRIVQFWHHLAQLPTDVEECIQTWAVWKAAGFEHRLFDERTSAAFIGDYLGARHRSAFKRCYHPAMQADYFRLCYVLTEGGIYVDADDVCVSTNIEPLLQDGRLKLQPLCYDKAAGGMVKPGAFLPVGAYEPNWIVYFNNNPLITRPKHPVIEHALEQATRYLELAGEDELLEIQGATGPGLISKSIFDLSLDPRSDIDIDTDVVVLKDWDSIAISKWPLSYRDDARNWRLSNQRRFNHGG